jgi:MerR family transcriptional regulator, light-induced transcriptional regulator
MSAGTWRIGAVARILGVPTATLRTWERRYGVVDPGRTDGQDRLYTEQDVERLRRIAWLRARGERVADLAALSLEALSERLGSYRQEGQATRMGPIRVLVLGRDPLGLDGSVPSGARSLVVTARAERLEDLANEGEADIAVLDLSLLGPDPLATISGLRDDWGLGGVIGVYAFATRRVRQALLGAGVRLVRAPADDLELRQMVGDLAAREALAPAASPPSPRFDLAGLTALVHRSVALACECPNQVSRLLIGLSTFETYSRDCASRSREDAELHRALADGTAHARVILEGLLVRVCEHEKIPLPSPAGPPNTF